MLSIVVVLNRLKIESKKDVTKTSAHNDEVDYEVASIDLFGETYLIKKVSMGKFSRYKVGWVLDNQTNTCMRCDGYFSLLKWRHHCRLCGYLICSNCSDKSLKFSVLKEAEPSSRVCKLCYNTYSPLRKHQLATAASSVLSLEPGAAAANNINSSNNDDDTKKMINTVDLAVEGSFFIGECSFNEDSFIVHDNNDNVNNHQSKDVITNHENVTNDVIADINNLPSQSKPMPSLIEPDKLYVPKMRPQLISSTTTTVTSDNNNNNLIEENQNHTLSNDFISSSSVNPETTQHQGLQSISTELQIPQSTKPNLFLVNTSTSNTASTINDPNNQHHFRDDSVPKRKTLPNDHTTVTCAVPQPIENSMISTDTKTAVNTALNAIVTAPVPLYLPVSPEQTAVNTSNNNNSIGIEESPLTMGNITPNSSHYSPLSTDIEKFGTPITRRIILEQAQSNVIWEATEHDDDSTSMGSATPRTGFTSKSNTNTATTAIRSTISQQHQHNLYENEFLHEPQNNTNNNNTNHTNNNNHIISQQQQLNEDNTTNKTPKLTASALHDNNKNNNLKTSSILKQTTSTSNNNNITTTTNSTSSNNDIATTANSTDNNIQDNSKTNSQLYQEQQIQAFILRSKQQQQQQQTINPTLYINNKTNNNNDNNSITNTNISQASSSIINIVPVVPGSPSRLPLLRRLNSSNNRSLI